MSRQTTAASRLRRAEVSLGLGPLAVDDRLKLSGEIILRRYWRRDDFHGDATGAITAVIPGYWSALSHSPDLHLAPDSHQM